MFTTVVRFYDVVTCVPGRFSSAQAQKKSDENKSVEVPQQPDVESAPRSASQQDTGGAASGGAGLVVGANAAAKAKPRPKQPGKTKGTKVKTPRRLAKLARCTGVVCRHLAGEHGSRDTWSAAVLEEARECRMCRKNADARARSKKSRTESPKPTGGTPIKGSKSTKREKGSPPPPCQFLFCKSLRELHGDMKTWAPEVWLIAQHCPACGIDCQQRKQQQRKLERLQRERERLEQLKQTADQPEPQPASESDAQRQRAASAAETTPEPRRKRANTGAPVAASQEGEMLLGRQSEQTGPQRRRAATAIGSIPEPPRGGAGADASCASPQV